MDDHGAGFENQILSDEQVVHRGRIAADAAAVANLEMIEEGSGRVERKQATLDENPTDRSAGCVQFQRAAIDGGDGRPQRVGRAGPQHAVGHSHTAADAVG